MIEFMKMTWQRGRQLATLQKGSTAVSYQYNESGLRTKKTVNGVTTIYDRDASGNIVHQKGGNNELWYYYDAQGNIGSISHNGTRYALRKNAQGDVIALMDTNGDVAAEYAYDAWGNVLDVTDYRGRTITDPNHVALANPIRYRGYFYDTETGFYYLQSRYYDPMTCRFLNADSVLDNRSVNTLNLFAYCGNNPVNNQDADGHFFFGALVGGIIGGAAGALTALVKGKSVTAGFITGAATGAAIGLVCDIVATGGMSAVAGVALCGVAAGVGNAVNQYSNYKIEKKAQTQNKKTTGNSQRGNSAKKTPTSSNGKLASECDSFADYVDYKSIAVSSITAMAFAPVSLGANYVVNSAFSGCETAGVTGFVAQLGANFAMGGNISILQSVIDLF